MLKYVVGNLLESGADVVAHCCNCHKVMGAGVAKALRLKWPRIYLVDIASDLSSEERLGTFTKSVPVTDTESGPVVYNLYGQLDTASRENPVAISYDALSSALELMADDLREQGFTGTIGIPKMGAGLAGGEWTVIENIVENTLGEFDVTVWCL